MSIEEVTPEKLAQAFHAFHQTLSTELNYGSERSADNWEELPEERKTQIVATARLVLHGLESNELESRRRYFAKPGEAEWGC